MIPFSTIKINGNPISLANLDKIEMGSVPDFPGWRRGYAFDARNSVYLIGWVREDLGPRLLYLTLANVGNKPVHVEDGSGLSIDIDRLSGYGWSDQLYIQALSSPTAGHATADAWMDSQGIDVAYTPSPGSPGMDFWLPQRAWVDWYGKSLSAIRRFDRYLRYQMLRPRQWLSPNGAAPASLEHIPRFLESGHSNPSSPIIPGFSQGAVNNLGLTFGDHQHADILELIDGFEVLGDPIYLEEALKLWGGLWRNGWELDPSYVLNQFASGSQHVVHSPRSWGWDFHNCGALIRVMANLGPLYDWIRGEIVQWIEWHLDAFSKAFPENCVSPPNWSLSQAITNHGVHFFSDWQLASTVPWGLQECSIGLRVYAETILDDDKRLSLIELADRCHDMAEQVLDYSDENGFDFDSGSFYQFRTIDGFIKVAGGLPGIGNWPCAPGLRSPKGKDRKSIEIVVDSIVGSWGLNPVNPNAVENYRPLMDGLFN